MKKILVPKRCNYIGAFLTLRCNLDCSYCINKQSDFIKQRKELTAEQWIKGLNRLKISKDAPISLGGGEPSLHQGFYEIIEKAKHPIDILTNLQFDVKDFVANINPKWLNNNNNPSYKSIRVSYHPSQMDMDNLLNKVELLQNAGFNVGIFALNLPENTESNMLMTEKARQKRIYFFIKDFLGYRDGQLFGHYKYPRFVDGIQKTVMCRTKELLIAPDGNTYRCHRDLYAKEMEIDNLLNENFEIKDIFRRCSRAGYCNFCDIKLKTNRFLQMGSCSVEIKEC